MDTFPSMNFRHCRNTYSFTLETSLQPNRILMERSKIYSHRKTSLSISLQTCDRICTHHYFHILKQKNTYSSANLFFIKISHFQEYQNTCNVIRFTEFFSNYKFFELSMVIFDKPFELCLLQAVTLDTAAHESRRTVSIPFASNIGSFWSGVS